MLSILTLLINPATYVHIISFFPHRTENRDLEAYVKHAATSFDYVNVTDPGLCPENHSDCVTLMSVADHNGVKATIDFAYHKSDFEHRPPIFQKFDETKGYYSLWPVNPLDEGSPGNWTVTGPY